MHLTSIKMVMGGNPWSNVMLLLLLLPRVSTVWLNKTTADSTHTDKVALLPFVFNLLHGLERVVWGYNTGTMRECTREFANTNWYPIK